MSNTKLDDLLSDLSVDELLNSLSTDLESAPKNTPSSKDWSMDEIDALLGIESTKSNTPKSVAKESDKSDELVQKSSDKKLETTVTMDFKERKEKVKTKEIKLKSEKPVEDIPISRKSSNNTAKPKAVPEQPHSEQPRAVKPIEEKKVTEVLKSKEPVKENATKKAKEDVKDTPFDDNKTRVFAPVEIAKQSDKDEGKASLPSSVQKSKQDDSAKTTVINSDAVVKASKEISDSKESIMELASEYAPDKPKVSQKTLTDIKPTYNEDIVHNISRKKIEKSTGGMESDKYRTRFINQPVQHIEKTAEYEKIHLNDPTPQIERPGFIVKKKNFSNTADLEPIPTIVSVENELEKSDSEKVKAVKGKANKALSDEEIAGQIKLSGFEEPEEIEKIDEEIAEKDLKKSRKEKLKNFKITADLDDISSEEFNEQDAKEEDADKSIKSTVTSFSNDYIDDEYTSAKDKEFIHKKLAKGTKFSLIFACIEAVIFIASIVISIISSSQGSSLSLFSGNVSLYMLVDILLLLLSCSFALSTFIRGMTGLFKFKINSATAPSLLFIFSIAQCIVVIFTMKDAFADTVIYAPVACFAFMMSAFSRFFVLKRAFSNFEFCTGGTALYSTEKIAKENDAFEIGRGLLLGEPDVSYSSRINFPEKFIEKSFVYDPSDKISSKLTLAILIAGIIVAIPTGILSKSVYDAFASFVAVCSIGFPAFSMISSSLPILSTNKKLNSRGSAILGYLPAFECATTNAIVIDSSDLFKKGSCGIDGIKTFNNMRIDEAILDAASMVIESGGPLVDIFDGVILNRREILPPVESLAYEDRLGLSAWIHGNRVLLGSRDLLLNHNVEAPEKDVEMKYINRGKKVLYLSVAGKIAAMFVISYYANDAIGEALRKIDENGITILVRTCDCNITEDLICQYFGLPISAVKIISPVSGDIFNKYRKETLEKSSSGIFHNGTEDSFLKSISQAFRLNKLVSINSIVQIIYSSVAVAMFALLSFLSALPSIGAGQIIAFQLFWTLIACLIPVFKKS